MVKTQSRVSAEAPPANADDDSSPMIVLPSSTDMFLFYGQSLEQCAKLSTGQALYDLSTMHKKWLRIYAGGRYVGSSLCPKLIYLPCNRGSFSRQL